MSTSLEIVMFSVRVSISSRVPSPSRPSISIYCGWVTYSSCSIKYDQFLSCKVATAKSSSKIIVWWISFNGSGVAVCTSLSARRPKNIYFPGQFLAAWSYFGALNFVLQQKSIVAAEYYPCWALPQSHCILGEEILIDLYILKYFFCFWKYVIKWLRKCYFSFSFWYLLNLWHQDNSMFLCRPYFQVRISKSKFFSKGCVIVEKWRDGGRELSRSNGK